MSQDELAGAVGDTVRHAGHARDVLVVVGAGAGDQGGVAAEDAADRASERRNDRRVVGRARGMDDQPIVQLEADVGHEPPGLAHQLRDLVPGRVQSFFQQKAAIEHRPAENQTDRLPELAPQLVDASGMAHAVSLDAVRVVPDADGVGRYVLTLRPAGVPAGDYVLRLSVRDPASGATGRSELAVAHHALELARRQPGREDLCYYLISKGRPSLEQALGYRVSLGQRLRRAYMASATWSYLGSIAIVTAFLLCLPIMHTNALGVSLAVIVALAALAAFPASDAATALVNRAVVETFPPRALTFSRAWQRRPQPPDATRPRSSSWLCRSFSPMTVSRLR